MLTDTGVGVKALCSDSALLNENKLGAVLSFRLKNEPSRVRNSASIKLSAEIPYVVERWKANLMR